MINPLNVLRLLFSRPRPAPDRAQPRPAFVPTPSAQAMYEATRQIRRAREAREARERTTSWDNVAQRHRPDDHPWADMPAAKAPVATFVPGMWPYVRLGPEQSEQPVTIACSPAELAGLVGHDEPARVCAPAFDPQDVAPSVDDPAFRAPFGVSVYPDCQPSAALMPSIVASSDTITPEPAASASYSAPEPSYDTATTSGYDSGGGGYGGAE